MYHSTPETQTDESYNHAEDFEHFAQHEQIERQEAIKEAEFQGITVEEAIAAHELHDEQASSTGGDGEVNLNTQSDEVKVVPKGTPKIQRQPPPEQIDPAVRYKDLSKDEASEWGSGEAGYRVPRSPAEKLGCVIIFSSFFLFADMENSYSSRNVPYKVRVLLFLFNLKTFNLRNACSINSGVILVTSDVITYLIILLDMHAIIYKYAFKYMQACE